MASTILTVRTATNLPSKSRSERLLKIPLNEILMAPSGLF